MKAAAPMILTRQLARPLNQLRRQPPARKRVESLKVVTMCIVAGSMFHHGRGEKLT